MLKDRKVIAHYENSGKTEEVNRGCPQGGVLSPILWNIVVDSLICTLNSTGYNTEGFADDLVILLIGKFKETLNDAISDTNGGEVVHRKRANN